MENNTDNVDIEVSAKLKTKNPKSRKIFTEKTTEKTFNTNVQKNDVATWENLHKAFENVLTKAKKAPTHKIYRRTMISYLKSNKIPYSKKKTNLHDTNFTSAPYNDSLVRLVRKKYNEHKKNDSPKFEIDKKEKGQVQYRKKLEIDFTNKEVKKAFINWHEKFTNMRIKRGKKRLLSQKKTKKEINKKFCIKFSIFESESKDSDFILKFYLQSLAKKIRQIQEHKKNSTNDNAENPSSIIDNIRSPLFFIVAFDENSKTIYPHLNPPFSSAIEENEYNDKLIIYKFEKDTLGEYKNGQKFIFSKKRSGSIYIKEEKILYSNFLELTFTNSDNAQKFTIDNAITIRKNSISGDNTEKNETILEEISTNLESQVKKIIEIFKEFRDFDATEFFSNLSQKDQETLNFLNISKKLKNI